jgi:glutaredoxin
MGTTEHFTDQVVMYGADWCIDCRNAKEVFELEGTKYIYVDLVADESAAVRAEEISGSKKIPVIIFPDGVFYVEPTKKELALKLRSLEAESNSFT